MTGKYPRRALALGEPYDNGHTHPDGEPCDAGCAAASQCDEGLDGRGAMYAELYARLAEKWGTVLEAADLAEDAQPDEVIAKLRGQGCSCPPIYLGQTEVIHQPGCPRSLLRRAASSDRATSQGDEVLRKASANCAAGDHDDCAGMVEQDAPGVGITPCRCPCHTLRENPDGTLQYPAGHFTTLAASLAASVNDELRAVMLVVSSLAHDIAREYAALAAEEERG